jgi:hypothetical protein
MQHSRAYALRLLSAAVNYFSKWRFPGWILMAALTLGVDATSVICIQFHSEM